MIRRSYFQLFLVCLLFTQNSCVNAWSKDLNEASNVDVKQSSDPFQWMENDENRLRSQLESYNKESNIFFADYPQMKSRRDRAVISAEATNIIDQLQVRSNGYYFLQKDPKSGSDTVKFLPKGAGSSRLLFAVESQKDGEHITEMAASPSGRYIAYALGRNGSEEVKIKIFDSRINRHLPDEFPRTAITEFSFLPDDSGVAYRFFGQLDSSDGSQRLYKAMARLHVFGQSTSQDANIFGYGMNTTLPVLEQDFPTAFFLQTPRIAIGMAMRNGPNTIRLYYKSIDQISDQSQSWQNFASEKDQILDLVIGSSSVVLVRSNGDGGILLEAVDFTDGKPNKTTLYQASNSVFQYISRTKDFIHLIVRNGTSTKIVSISSKSKKVVRTISSRAGEEFVRLYSDEWGAETVVQSLSYMRPVAYSLLADAGQALIPLQTLPSDKAWNDLEVIEGKGKSADGTYIPYLVVKARETKLTEHTPLILRVYAAYGIISRPRYDAHAADWFASGGAIAYCFARGGGEGGPAWHLAGQGQNKINSMLDTVTCADDLKKHGISRSERMALFSGSAGGVITSWMIANRPDVFSAVLVYAGNMNVSRLDQIPTGGTNFPEFGDPGQPQDRQNLEKIDGYRHLKPATYPAIFIQHGWNDSRVPPWMASKFAARVKENQRGSAPIFMTTDFEGGHNLVGVNTTSLALAWSDLYSFLDKIWKLNLKEGKAPTNAK